MDPIDAICMPRSILRNAMDSEDLVAVATGYQADLLVLDDY